MNEIFVKTSSGRFSDAAMAQLTERDWRGLFLIPILAEDLSPDEKLILSNIIYAFRKDFANRFSVVFYEKYLRSLVEYKGLTEQSKKNLVTDLMLRKDFFVEEIRQRLLYENLKGAALLKKDRFTIDRDIYFANLRLYLNLALFGVGLILWL
jgi:hypothetical protein